MVGFDVSRPHQLMGLDSQPFRIQHRLQQERSNAGAINKPGLHGAIRMFAAMLPAPPAPMASWAGSGLEDWHSARAGLVPGSRLALLRVNALSHRFQHPLPPLPLHSTHSTHSTSQLLPSFTRRVDVMTTSSSFQHLHLHIPIQNPHLYEIGACYAGGPRSQQFLIQLFAVTPTRARREVPASWGPSLQVVPLLTVLCFRA